MSSYTEELDRALPHDLPHRQVVIAKTAQHLALIEEANRQFNLTRITGPWEAAIKHVLDSVMPWRLFVGARHVLDAGTGAGLPGIPLALVLPEVRFTLSESTLKKARFVEAAVEKLQPGNVKVEARRAEELARDGAFDIITARAVAPLERAVGLFAPAIAQGSRMLLYKGPDAGQEIAEAAAEARKRRIRMEVVLSYELPDSAGARTIVEMRVGGFGKLA
jgi:16S rRNA (guanine527-N7)-methyltransferase